jgi:hypothetical protein
MGYLGASNEKLASKIGASRMMEKIELSSAQIAQSACPRCGRSYQGEPVALQPIPRCSAPDDGSKCAKVGKAKLSDDR